jgi:hypothetical protein
LLEQLENALVNYRRGNEDFFNLSKSLDNYLDVSVDVKALGVLSDHVKIDPIKGSLSDAEFLAKEKVLAETALIKSSIIYKCHNGLPLSANEKRYAKAWMQRAKDSKTLVTNDVMIPAAPSAIRMDTLKPEDFYALNNITGVEFDRKQHGAFALNDLVLELSHLIDRDTIRKVELKMLEGKLKHEFALGHDFSLVDRRNKEIDLVH